MNIRDEIELRDMVIDKCQSIYNAGINNEPISHVKVDEILALCKKRAIEAVELSPEPYPVEMNGLIKTDKHYALLIPDKSVRTSISWYLMGEARRTMKTEAIERLDKAFSGEEDET
jgi:hypothetical protein